MPRRHRPKGFKQHAHENKEFRKIWKINEALRSHNRPLLCRIAREEGGFVNNALRRRVWPMLLHSNSSQPLEQHGSTEKHKDEMTVKLDTARSFNTFPRGIDEKRKLQLQSELEHVILSVLRAHPKLHYYQGFHDICGVFLLLFGQEMAARLMEHTALFFLRDAMLESMEPILRELTILDTLIAQQDPELAAYITEAGVLPFYCLSWVITWFSHDLDDVNKIARLFDVFLTSNPLMPLYMSAAVVLARRTEILGAEQDPSTLHNLLRNIPSGIDIQAMIDKAVELESKYSPVEWQSLSGIGLDQVSAVNSYDTIWLRVFQDEDSITSGISQAHDILSTSPEERKPLELKAMATTQQTKKTHQGLASRVKDLYATRDATTWALLAVGAGIGTVAVLLSQNDWIREWAMST